MLDSAGSADSAGSFGSAAADDIVRNRPLPAQFPFPFPNQARCRKYRPDQNSRLERLESGPCGNQLWRGYMTNSSARLGLVRPWRFACQRAVVAAVSVGSAGAMWTLAFVVDFAVATFEKEIVTRELVVIVVVQDLAYR